MPGALTLARLLPNSVPGLEGQTSSSGSAPSAVSARQEAESGEGGAPSAEEGEEPLSRLRSPSVMEVREKGYERLKEELAKAQRVSFIRTSDGLYNGFIRTS